MNVRFDFTGQVALVTGAGGNLGRAVGRAFLEAGASLALVELQVGVLPTIFPELVASPRGLLLEGVDVTQSEQAEESVQRTLTHFGRLDILVNTVGGYLAGQPLHETSLETWETMVTLNARSVFTMCKAALPPMIAQRRGKIVNVAAASALKGDANSAAYAASKAAVARLTESMAAEYKRLGINVNAVLPSILDTPQNRAAMPNADFSQWVTPEAMAQVILFLASEAARPLHGVLLPVFGTR